ncbi:MAG: division/cell wall cluster transcriptional repressor MraZ [Pseudomonadota bacterium]
MFTSEFPFKVDRKGRVSVPADYRTAFALQSFNGVVLIPLENELAFEGYTDDRLQALSASLDDPDAYETEEEREDAYDLFTSAKRLPIDGDGRIVLNEDLRAHAQITDKVVYAGRGNHFRLWNPEAFEAYKAARKEARKTRGKPPTLKMSPAMAKAGPA